MVAVIFCTETSRYVNCNLSNQHWASRSNLYNESNAQNKFAFKCWSFHASNVVHQLPSFCMVCFAIFADEVVLLIFVLQTFSWNRSPIYFFALLFLRLKHFEASALLLCLVMPITVGSGMRKTCQRKNLDAVINIWVRYGHQGKLSQILMFV